MANKDFDEAEASNMASKMGANATEADVENVRKNMGKMNKGPLAKIWDKVVQLWDAFRSPNTPTSLKAIIIGGLIYMVSPIDLVPDVIPVVGLLDDASVIGIVFSQFARIMGTAAVAGAIATAAIKLVKINKQNIQIEMQKKHLTELIVKEMPTAKKINCLGIHNDGTEEEITFESENDISYDIKVGMKIYA